MRLIAAPILILLIIVQSFSQWLVIGAFKINQSYIAKNTCENRYRPQLKCNGNCVLMKKLKQQEQEEQNGPATLKLDAPLLILSSRSFFATTPEVPIRSCNYFFPLTNSGSPVDRAFSFFHPPRA
ncbi:MAG: hypothetical protein NTW29_11990 [Bacteroidetes bacterium]|nr:hypothetical protein [Bacteroidota bacterium]